MLPSILLLLLGGQSEQLAIIGIVYRVQAGFPGGSAVKNLPVMQETQVGSLGLENPLEEGRATHPSLLARRIPWTQEPGRLQSMGSQGLDTT